MNNSAIFFETLVNDKHKLLGLELKPFCLLHLLWLQHIGSPLFVTSNPATIQDVELAALICSSTSNEEILAKLSPGTGWQRFRRNLWRKKNKKASLPDEVRAFIRFQDDYCSLPQFWEKEGGGGDEKIPWLLTYAAGLIKSTGWDFAKVITLPLGQVIWLNITFGYLESGQTTVISDKEKQAMELLKALTPEGEA